MDYGGLGLIGAIIAALAGLYYLWTIIKGETKPQKVTWFGWSLATILGAWTAFDGGAGKGALVAATFAAVLTVTFILSLFPRFGKPGAQTMDYIVAAGATAVLLIWRFGHFPVAVATTLAIVADLWFSWLTIREAWRQPETEALYPWIIGTVACALGVAALESFSYVAAAFPVYITVINCIIVGALATRKLARA